MNETCVFAIIRTHHNDIIVKGQELMLDVHAIISQMCSSKGRRGWEKDGLMKFREGGHGMVVNDR